MSDKKPKQEKESKGREKKNRKRKEGGKTCKAAKQQKAFITV